MANQKMAVRAVGHTEAVTCHFVSSPHKTALRYNVCERRVVHHAAVFSTLVLVCVCLLRLFLSAPLPPLSALILGK